MEPKLRPRSPVRAARAARTASAARPARPNSPGGRYPRRCHRDSPLVAPQTLLPRVARTARAARFGPATLRRAFGWAATTPAGVARVRSTRTVSYTHLTLPTIYSV